MIDFSYLTGPVVALIAFGVIVLLCRWVFSTADRDERAARRRAQAQARGAAGDFGLLVPVATTRTAEDAALLCDVLAGEGIRCTVAGGERLGELVVLVFRADAARAERLVRSG